jgi:hypothetical protein
MKMLVRIVTNMSGVRRARPLGPRGRWIHHDALSGVPRHGRETQQLEKEL